MITQSNGKSHFYHASARKIVAAFGTLFNNIKLEQYDGAGVPQKSIKVPIIYSSKQHFIAKQREALQNKDLKTNITLPTITFILESMTYDPSRQINPLNYKTQTNPLDPYVKDKRWNPVPYIYNFNLSVHANKTEDGLQIIEQIVPWFSPEFNLAINMVDELIDVPIGLNDISFEDNWEEGFDNNRMIQWNLSFEAKGLFYKPLSTPTNIQRVVVDLHNDEGFSTPIEFGTLTTANFSYLVDDAGDYIVDDAGDNVISQEE